MEKIKLGKMDKRLFWIAMAVVCFLFIMLAVNLQTGDMLGDIGRGAAVIIAFVIYMAACAMRLRDAGKSMAQLLILFILPIIMIVIARYESEDDHFTEELELNDKDAEN